MINTDNLNRVCIIGELVTNFETLEGKTGEKLYTAIISAKRLSNRSDLIPIQIPSYLIDIGQSYTGSIVKIVGQYQSSNTHENGKHHLVLAVMVSNFEVLDNNDAKGDELSSKIELIGYICKKPIYRETPFGREITELLLAVNRTTGESDYIPCIVWWRKARYASTLEIGTKVKLEGRIQSREYIKKINDDECEKRTAYEVSVRSLEVIAGDNKIKQ